MYRTKRRVQYSPGHAETAVRLSKHTFSAKVLDGTQLTPGNLLGLLLNLGVADGTAVEQLHCVDAALTVPGFPLIRVLSVSGPSSQNSPPDTSTLKLISFQDVEND